MLESNVRFKKQFSKLNDLAFKYLLLLDINFGEIKKFVFDENLELYKRKKKFGEFRTVIEELKREFREVIWQQNAIARLRGYPNYFMFFLAKNQIPASQYALFLKKIDTISIRVTKDFPATEISKKFKEWSYLNIPYPYGNLRFPDPFSSRSDIIEKVSEYSVSFRRYYKEEKRIHIVDGESIYYSCAKYLPVLNVVEVRISRDLINSTYRSLVFIHELGHAVAMLQEVDRGNNPNKLSIYHSEYKANKFVYKILRAYVDRKTQEVIRYNLLSDLAFALFQIEIYTDDKQNFDVAYARAINKCYPMARQKKNPFYVLNKDLIISPLEDLIDCMAFVEFYVKDMGLNP